MNAILFYILEVSLATAVFYGLWKLLLQKDTFFMSQRFFLLGSLSVSLVMPLMSIRLPETVSTAIPSELLTVWMLDQVTVGAETQGISVFSIFLLAYAAVSCFLLARFIGRLLSIRAFKKQCEVQVYQGVQIHVTERSCSPFSFMNAIFFSREDLNLANFHGIFTHELSHVKQKHSFDLIVIELLTILFWINPFIYLYRKQLKTIHEYLSDEEVILQAFEPDEYKMLLIRQQLGYHFEPANYFNKSVTLKRIDMLNKNKSRNLAKLKYLLSIPVFAMLLVMFSFSKGTIMPPDINSSAQVQDTIYDEVDEMPVFPGGEAALMTFVAKNVKYPEASKKNGEQGIVYVKFVVDKKGKVKNPTIEKGVTKGLDDESLRVVGLLPDFEKPGYKNGKAVSVHFILPIKYKLE